MDDMPYLTINNALKDCAELLKDILTIQDLNCKHDETFEDLMESAKEKINYAILVAEDNSVNRECKHHSEDKVELVEKVFDEKLFALRQDLKDIESELFEVEKKVRLSQNVSEITEIFINKIENLVVSSFKKELEVDIEYQEHMSEACPY